MCSHEVRRRLRAPVFRIALELLAVAICLALRPPPSGPMKMNDGTIVILVKYQNMNTHVIDLNASINGTPWLAMSIPIRYYSSMEMFPFVCPVLVLSRLGGTVAVGGRGAICKK